MKFFLNYDCNHNQDCLCFFGMISYDDTLLMIKVRNVKVSDITAADKKYNSRLHKNFSFLYCYSSFIVQFTHRAYHGFGSQSRHVCNLLTR